MSSSSSIPALRQLLHERFPSAARSFGTALSTGILAIDEVTGGLPRPGLTEVVCAAPSCGSQLFLGQVLQSTRAQALRVALVDEGDIFDSGSWPASLLEHLVWVRAHRTAEAMAAADLLARDANLSLVVLDLRHASPADLRRIPSTQWYRLQRAIEPATLACLVFTPTFIVPCAQLRLELSRSHGLSAQSRERPRLGQELAPAFLRQRSAGLAAAV